MVWKFLYHLFSGANKCAVAFENIATVGEISSVIYLNEQKHNLAKLEKVSKKELDAMK